jgi:hypothetical protein
MSLADLRWLAGGKKRWEGLRPPSALPGAIYRDLQWHLALYREDGLTWRERLVFAALRVVQRVTYNLGWHVGGVR